jgi:putative transposase
MKDMKKAFKYRIYPTKKQNSELEKTFELCRELHNAAIEERQNAYEITGKSISYTAQQNQLPGIKKDRPEYKQIHSQVLQNVLDRVDKAFDSFFQRLREGKKPGYPRFKSRDRYKSITFPQSGFDIINGRLALSKIGHIKIVLHRPIEGIIKTCTLKRMPTGKWFVIFVCEVMPKRLPESEEEIGIDAGLKHFATLSNGESIENPRFFREEEKELAKAQRALSKAPKGSNERKKKKKVVARLHERITNKRENFCHQEARKIVNIYGIIIVEALKILNMMQNSKLSKSIVDAAWGMFFSCLGSKAEEAGRLFIQVSPYFTSQECCICHNRKELTLADRIYRCSNPLCNMVLDRDWNAALNILRLGLQSVRL